MAELIIACLSQKGGVGKSTLARLIATSYAEHDQRVGLMDFNPKQQTAVIWTNLRNEREILPVIHAEVATQANRLRTDKRFDVIVADGRPDSPDVTLSIAKAADLVVIPTSISMDDLLPQSGFALELIERGVPRERIILVINRHTDNKGLIAEAETFLKQNGLTVAENTLPYRDSFIRCQTGGYSVGEVRKALMGNLGGLEKTAIGLATEIATIAANLE